MKLIDNFGNVISEITTMGPFGMLFAALIIGLFGWYFIIVGIIALVKWIAKGIKKVFSTAD